MLLRRLYTHTGTIPPSSPRLHIIHAQALGRLTQRSPARDCLRRNYLIKVDNHMSLTRFGAQASLSHPPAPQQASDISLHGQPKEEAWRHGFSHCSGFADAPGKPIFDPACCYCRHALLLLVSDQARMVSFAPGWIRRARKA